jgi:MFS family permease
VYLSDRSPVPEAGIRTRGRPAATVVLLGLVSLFTDLSSESVSSVLALYLTTVVGLSPLGYGLVDGLYQGVSAVVRIAGGWVADRTDHPKWVAFSGYGVSAISRLALIPAHSLGAITAVLTADRLGKGIRTAPRDAMIAASSPPESLGRSFGVHRTLDTLGAVLGPLVAFLLLWWLPGDFTAVFLVSFVAALIGLALLLLLVPDLRPAGGRARALVAKGRSLLREATLRRLLAATALLSVLTVGDGFIYLSIQRRDDLAIAYFPLLYVGTNIAYLSLAWVMGRLADRVGRARIFVTAHLALLAAYLCAAGPALGHVTAIACLLLLGTYYAGTDGQLAAITSAAFGPDSRGRALSAVQTAQAAARFFSSVLFGLLWVSIGIDSAFLLVTVLLAAGMVGAAVLLRDLRPVASPVGGPAS